ncbi:hypothetical protein C8R48DRAFT_675009 [Suillus tomentosus]|nr:hypothetical protein C8R48DRAFT_675009 [Suillus tomentosus]
MAWWKRKEEAPFIVTSSSGSRVIPVPRHCVIAWQVKKGFADRMFNWLESIISYQARKPPHNCDEMDPRLEIPPSAADMDGDSFKHEFTEYLSCLAVECNWHVHNNTCFKHLRNDVTTIDPQTGTIELRRWRGRVLDYATKMFEAYAEVQPCASAAQGERTLITKTVNAIMGKQEMSHQQVMSCLVGGGDYYTSHMMSSVKVLKGKTSVRISLTNKSRHFDGLCLWEFVERTVKEKGDITVPHDRAVDDDVDNDVGQKMLPRAKFAQGHTQVATHILRLCKKFVVPVLLGNTIPRPDKSDKEYTLHCRALMLLFKPWRNLRDLKGEPSIIKNMDIENECKDARDAHATLVREQGLKPHVYGTQQNDQTQVDMDTFEEALFADATLDEEDEEECSQENRADSVIMDPDIRDIQHCLRAALDGGLFTNEGQSRLKGEPPQDADTHLVNDDKEGRLAEFTSLMRATKKQKRPVDVGRSDDEVKHARVAQQETDPAINFAQMEEDTEITSVYHKPELSTKDKEIILEEIIKEFGLTDNEEQQMSLRIISEHFI